MRSLIADDDSISRMMLARYLEEYGECDSTADGGEALDAFRLAVGRQRPYDLVCLDVQMPRMDGPTALRAMRALEEEHGLSADQRAAILLSTGADDSGSLLHPLGAMCQGCLIKPYESRGLLKELQRIGLPVGQ